MVPINNFYGIMFYLFACILSCLGSHVDIYNLDPISMVFCSFFSIIFCHINKCLGDSITITLVFAWKVLLEYSPIRVPFNCVTRRSIIETLQDPPHTYLLQSTDTFLVTKTLIKLEKSGPSVLTVLI